MACSEDHRAGWFLADFYAVTISELKKQTQTGFSNHGHKVVVLVAFACMCVILSIKNDTLEGFECILIKLF